MHVGVRLVFGFFEENGDTAVLCDFVFGVVNRGVASGFGWVGVFGGEERAVEVVSVHREEVGVFFFVGDHSVDLFGIVWAK